jgi:hypothetical protein
MWEIKFCKALNPKTLNPKHILSSTAGDALSKAYLYSSPFLQEEERRGSIWIEVQVSVFMGVIGKK